MRVGTRRGGGRSMSVPAFARFEEGGVAPAEARADPQEGGSLIVVMIETRDAVANATHRRGRRRESRPVHRRRTTCSPISGWPEVRAPRVTRRLRDREQQPGEWSSPPPASAACAIRRRARPGHAFRFMTTNADLAFLTPGGEGAAVRGTSAGFLRGSREGPSRGGGGGEVPVPFCSARGVRGGFDLSGRVALGDAAAAVSVAPSAARRRGRGRGRGRCRRGLFEGENRAPPRSRRGRCWTGRIRGPDGGRGDRRRLGRRRASQREAGDGDEGERCGPGRGGAVGGGDG